MSPELKVSEQESKFNWWKNEEFSYLLHIPWKSGQDEKHPKEEKLVTEWEEQSIPV